MIVSPHFRTVRFVPEANAPFRFGTAGTRDVYPFATAGARRVNHGRTVNFLVASRARSRVATRRVRTG